MEGHFNSQWLFSLGDPELAGTTEPTTERLGLRQETAPIVGRRIVSL